MARSCDATRSRRWSEGPDPTEYHMGYHMGYHMVMARRQVLVQLDDDLVEQLDELASNLGTNRSELLRRGARAVLEAEELAGADRRLRTSYRLQPADLALVQSARQFAGETAPAW
jgi:Arc/MetJ-type ribon-helix-helix transcriptional regulator